jgi:hypothetical protein
MCVRIPCIALTVSILAAGCASSGEDAAHAFWSPEFERERRSLDTELLAGTGIDLAAYHYEYIVAAMCYDTYRLRDHTRLAERFRDLAGELDLVRRDPPSLAELARRFGLPPKIRMYSGTAGDVIVEAWYGSNVESTPLLFMYGAGSENPNLISVCGPVPGFSMEGAISIGSKFDDVFAAYGSPVKRLPRIDAKMMNRVFYDATFDDGSSKQYIVYGEKGVMFCGGNSEVREIDFMSPEKLLGDVTWNGAEVPVFSDIRWKDVSQVNTDFTLDLVRTLSFNEATIFPDRAKDVVEQVMKEGLNPGLGIRSLHEKGITGKGVNVAIIDQLVRLDHPWYRGKVVAYRDLVLPHDVNQGSMHGPGVLSLLVGEANGVAPGAKVWYAAAPTFSDDARYIADALLWIVKENRRLPAGEKIRVVSISATPTGPGSPYTKNNMSYEAAVEAAKAEGIMVLDATKTFGLVGPGFYLPNDPENPASVQFGYPGNRVYMPRAVLAPCSYRTLAEEYWDNSSSWHYVGRGGLSWGIPYVAGVLALGWQVNPDLTMDSMELLLKTTSKKLYNQALAIDPVAFVEAARNYSNSKDEDSDVTTKKW